MKALKWINTGAFAAMVAVSALAEGLPIGGKTTGQISESFPNLFTPAPITFAIWGLIYLLLMFFTIYQLGVLDGHGQSTKVRDAIGIWFCISCLLNILWIFFWHYQLIGLSVLSIVLLLIVLNMITNRVNRCSENTGVLQQITTNAGFSIYYGWIIAATIANISVYLTAKGWDGWGINADIWTVVVLLLGAIIASAVAIVKKDRLAALAIMWAYAGILIRHISSAYYGATHPGILAAGFISEALILIAVLLPGFCRNNENRTAIACSTRSTKQEDIQL